MRSKTKDFTIISRHSLCLRIMGLALCAALWVGPAQAQLYQFFPRTGSINWEQQVVIAVGEGHPTPDTPPGEYRTAAREQALTRAEKNLTTLVREINIDGNHRNRDLFESYGTLAADLPRLIQTARILDTRMGANGRTEISLMLSLNTIAGWIGSVMDDSRAAGNASPLAAVTGGDMSGERVAPAGAPVTGVIVDARGIALEPALFPLILNSSREILYSARWHTSQHLSVYRAMSYVQKMSAARKLSHISGNPRAIRAIGARGKYRANILLDRAGSDSLRTILEHNPQILREGKIVILMD